METGSAVTPLHKEPLAAPLEGVRLLGRYRSTNMVVTIERKTWNDCPQIDEHATVHWVLSKAILGQSLTPTGGRMAPMLITWSREGERLARRQYPTDFDSLAELGRTGWEFEATVGLRGGMDSAQPGGEGVQPRAAPEQQGSGSIAFDKATEDEFKQLDTAVREVMAGRGNPSNPLKTAARQLLAPIRPQNWAELTDPIYGEISPARILALRYVVHVHQAELQAIPLASWTSSSNLLGIRFCEVNPSMAGWTGGSMAEAKQLIVGELVRIDGLRAAANYDWQTIKTSIKIDGELSATGATVRWGVQVLVPQGPWTQGLLTGAIALMAGAYAVPLPHSTYVEVTLDPRTTLILKGLWRLLGLDGALFRGLIRYALGRALEADMIGVRVTTSAYSHGGEGKKGKCTFFPADHSDSKIVIGVEATKLLQAGRIESSLMLQLGYAATFPVTIETPCPDTPGYALRAMLCTKDQTIVRYRTTGAQPTTRDIVLGYVGVEVDIAQTGAHLPAGWLSSKLVNSQADQAWAMQLLRQILQRNVGASTMIPIGRLKKGGGDPAYLFIMFPSDAAATRFCEGLDTRTLPDELANTLGTFLDPNGRLATFCAYIPPEPFQLCPEKEIIPLFKAGLTEQAIINPAPPNAQI